MSYGLTDYIRDLFGQMEQTNSPAGRGKVASNPLLCPPL